MGLPTSIDHDRLARRIKHYRPAVCAAAIQILRFAKGAQLPFVAPVISIAVDLLDMLEAVKANDQSCRDLLEIIKNYAQRINDFIEAMSQEYSGASGDLQERIAEEAIAHFHEHLYNVKRIVEEQRRAPRLLKFLGIAPIKQQLQDCSQQLSVARQDFVERKSDIIIAGIRDVQVSSSRFSTDSAFEDFNIAGAKALSGHYLGRLQRKVRLTFGLPPGEPSFWKDIVSADIGNEPKLVKMYYNKSGGEEAFLQDIKFLAQNVACNLPTIEAYCSSACTPFIVLKIASVTAFTTYLTRLHGRSPEMALTIAWKLLIDMREAGDFLLDNNDLLDSERIDNALRSATVDDLGQVIIAPSYKKGRGGGDKDERSIDLVPFVWGWTLERTDLRPYRSLALALLGNSKALLGTLPDELEDIPDPAAVLRRYWPSESERYLAWPHPSVYPPDLLPGDFGVFDFQPGMEPEFRRLGSVRPALGGVEPTVNHLGWNEHMGNNIFRVTFQQRDISQDRQQWETSAHFIWWNRLAKRDAMEWQYLLQNARRLAKEHRVLPENIVLLTRTSCRVHSDMFLLPNLKRDVHCYVHLAKDGQLLRYYWSYNANPAPVTDGETEPPQSPVPALPKLHQNYMNRPVDYLQLEAGDLS